jgi:aminopeptidase N
MKDSSPQPIHLSDYRQPEFWIPNIELHFSLAADGGRNTIVRSKLFLERNKSLNSNRPLVLNGEKLKLLSVAVDGVKRLEGSYTLTDSTLTLDGLPDKCVVEIAVEIDPEANLSCEGLYKSGGFYCTQCEAESFRRITYFLDRPDVMSVYQVTIDAPRSLPVLLSNGNPVSARELPNDRHEVVWRDPSRKPCYLFALVAGDLGVLEDHFVTKSGRRIKLQIFARHGLQDRCGHAMDSLKWSMKWDEDTYGLEYDLDIFMIFVAEEFNMGAMENKGLNVFNASYILANPETATDSDYEGITAVVGHEYFHNWTGNRVTCRDWFQLSLKEGLTVFRDQRFSADLGSAAVNRLDDVTRLRTVQFAEDSGPMAHPIRPRQYITIDNFYTTTVYEKGAEVIRMIETIVGRDGFRKGMDLYFKRHDGQAVTTEEFVAAMADANDVDLMQFRDSWYNQPGTPHVKVATSWNPAKEQFAVTLTQSSKPTPGFATKMPYHIPIAVGLLSREGREMPLQLSGGAGRLSNGEGQTTMVLHLRESEQTFLFEGVREKPVLSFLRKFSAPVKVEFDRSNEEFAFLMANDPDSFSRWEAAQTLTIRMVKSLCEDLAAGHAMRAPSQLVECFGPILSDASIDAEFKSYLLALPTEQYLAQFFEIVNVDHIHAAREHIRAAIARTYRAQLTSMYDTIASAGTEGREPGKGGLRSLRSRLLNYLVVDDDAGGLDRAARQRREARNMTDEIGALSALSQSRSPIRTQELQAFYAKWKNEALVMNKWLMIQAAAPIDSALEDVRRLSKDPVFDKNNPNKISALYRAFAQMNSVRFNAKDGSGYKFIADQIIEIDSRNPQVASRLATSFYPWRTLDSHRQELAKGELKRILATQGLSSNVFEIVSKSLAN